MRVLAIDTSSNVLGVAVLDEDGGSVEFNFNLGLRHASHLAPTVKKVLGFADLGLKDIDAYCVSIGPGSFTGLRIGVSAVKALWLACKKKVAAVPTLDVLACNIPATNNTICIVVDAKKEKFYACFYEYKNNILKRLTPYLLIGRDDLLKRLTRIKNDILLVGDGITVLNTQYSILNTKKSKRIHFTSKEFWYPRAVNVARIGIEMLKQDKVVKDVDALVPLYLHPRDVQCKK